MSEASQEVGIGKIIKGLLGFSAMRYFLLCLVPKVGLPILFIYLLFVAWVNLGPQKPKVNVIRQRAADRAAEKALGEIREHRGSLSNVKMIHFANDPTDCISQKFRDVLEGTGILNLTDSTCGEKFRNLANLRETGCASSSDAVKIAQGEDVDGVLWGVVDRFESFGEGVLLKGFYQLVELPSGRVVWEGRLDEDTITASVVAEQREKVAHPDGLDRTKEAVEVAASRVRWHIRFLWFALVMLLLPVVTISFLRTMVAKRSNRVNALVLAIYTIIDLIFAFFMVGGAFGSFVQVMLFLIAGGVALGYNVCLMNFALRLEGE